VLYNLLTIFIEYNKNTEDKIDLKFLSEAYLFEIYKKNYERIEKFFEEIT
jgi:hypothetical protein